MNAKKEKAIELAKSLYVDVNADGTKKYTLQQIAKQIQNKCKIAIDLSTVSRWAKKYDWEGLFEKIKMAGIEKGKQQLQEKENQIVDEKAQTIADIYKSNKQIQKISQTTILSRLTGQDLKDSSGNTIESNVSTRDAISLLQYSEQVLLNLHEKKIGIKDIQKDNPSIIVTDSKTKEELERLIND